MNIVHLLLYSVKFRIVIRWGGRGVVTNWLVSRVWRRLGNLRLPDRRTDRYVSYVYTVWNVTDGLAAQWFVWNSCRDIRFEWKEPNPVWFLSCWNCEWCAKIFFFQDVALIFIKHYYSWHSWEKNDIKAVLIFILKEIFMNEPNDLYYFVPLKKLIEQPRFSKSYQSLIHLANCFLGFEGSATTYNLFHGRFTILILFYRTQIFQWDER